MAQRKPFKELDLSNSFLFAAALEDEETCRLVLEIILGKPVESAQAKPLSSGGAGCNGIEAWAGF